MSYNTVSPQTLYQARPEFQQELKKVHDHLHYQLSPYMNHTVRVQTMDHQVYEGTIAHMDADHLYLRVPQQYHSSSLGAPIPDRSYAYNNVILPLVLFNLLVIVLLS
ncbi:MULTISPECIES: hypothetical protein [Paenibacillus]|jgi:hypothetical protein|uniref:hypothetical protein n=1 Tax=Paenibacillus TaxID=44249 RepID=UPI0005CEC254|nr:MULTISPECIES: hypothetical protein [Paenibacillus]KAE8559935.1 hypothetical protein BJH92_11730 [Paenibacillus polymyxa]KAF6585038.1 hypothetical protein G9G57_07740 [Paenibacillus sp. EKM211P]KJD40813.1 hypothetical protein QD46_06370 [Paenibacillus polymyxa]MBE3650528.1 hypothetical protein [Paenibacillus polymyxa]MBY0020832.1 hypothetical protein [Paenibacillus polymyxa]